jgi:histidine kinase/histidine kinase/DNA gyrase B/HSP90-like ATPase
MTVLRVAALLIYTFGVYAYGALLVLWSRDVSRAARTSAPGGASESYQTVLVSGALFAVSFLWFITNLLMVTLQLAPGGAVGWSLFACLWAALLLALAFPPLITHMVWAEAHDAHPTLATPWGLVVGLTYLLAGSAAIVCTLGFSGVGGVSINLAKRVVANGTLALFIGAAVYSIALLMRHPLPRPADRDARSTRWHIGLFGVMALLFVFVFALDRQSSTAALVGGSLEIATRSLPLAFMFVGTYFEHRFEFFDIFVKRGLSLFVTMGLLALSFTIALPVLQRYQATWAAPWVYAVVLLPLAMALPWLHACIGTVLDRRWLGRRFSAVEAVKHFLASLRSATTEEQLVERAEAGLTEIFDAPTAVRLEGSPTPTTPAFEVIEDIEIRSAGGLRGRFFMGRRRTDAPYFSEDLGLLGSLADVFASVLENLRLQIRELEQDRRARDLSLHASRSELKALRAQINPHFLFNALNAIAGLIHRDPVVADRTIEKLAEVFRYTLRGAEAEWTVLDDELEFVRAYLDVEQARFGTRLVTDVDLAENARGARVPTMVVQTLVENAVKHGAAAVRGQALVRVSARRDHDRLHVVVVDNGPGFPSAEHEATRVGSRPGGHGLASIRRRLDGYFGDAAALVVSRDTAHGRTIASLTMPFAQSDVRATQVSAGWEMR